MPPTHDESDRRLDRNLKALAQHVALPAEPTDTQRARWKQPATADAAAPMKGWRFMKQHRVAAFFGASTTLAASLILGIVLLGPQSQERVAAATIFQSFRDALSGAFTLSFQDIYDDGIRAHGQALIVFGDDAEPAEAPDRDAAYIKVHLQADADHPDVPGLAIDAVAVNAPDNHWAYLNAGGLDISGITQPVALFLYQMARGGVLFELDGLLDMDGEFNITRPTNPIADASDIDPGKPIRFGFSLGMTTSKPRDAADSDSAADDDESNDTRFSLSFGTVHGDDDEAPQAEPAHAERIEQAEPDVNLASLRTARTIVDDFIRGRTTPEQVGQIISWIESAADNVTVTPQPDDSHVLHATSFRFELPGMDDEDRAQLERVVLEIAYHPDNGILWAQISNLGDAGGTILFERVEANMHDPLFDRTPYLEDMNVRVIDLAALAPMFQSKDRPPRRAADR